MATFKAEDVAVSIDGTELAAIDVRFSSAVQKSEERRFGQIINPSGFSTTGPDRASLDVSFYLTGSGSSTYNIIDELLSGLDVLFTTGATIPYPEALGLYKPMRHSNNTVFIQDRNEHLTYHIAKPTAGSLWNLYGPTGSTLQVRSATWPWTAAVDWTFGASNRTGYMGCITGSNISLGGAVFASGAALTNLSIDIVPFSPVICKASFDIFNKVTGKFNSGQASISVDPNNVAHGLYSTYSGIFDNVDEVKSISLTYSASRSPRYVIGQQHVEQIMTTKASKQVSFQGYGRSDTLADPATPFTITLGSANAPDIFTDTVRGIIVDDSFSIPNVGIISKDVKIVENLI